MTDYTEVDGVDYSPDAIEAIREELCGHRDASMKVWPDGIAYSVLMTHVIALLAKLKWYEEEARKAPPEPTRSAPPPSRPRTQSAHQGLPSLPPQQGTG